MASPLPVGVSLVALASRFLGNRQGFAATLTAPALVWEGASSTTDEDEREFRSQLTTAGPAPNPLETGETIVYFLQKDSRKQNAFPMAVTVGRLANNDIVLDQSSISRFHAYLQLDSKSGKWTITDAGSDNGTFIDGQRLEKNARAVVPDGATLSFGSAKLRFLTPASLVAWLERQASGKR
jgi:pSer/pThr/pTyr-binding forkhead associated (FHA) protein